MASSDDQEQQLSEAVGDSLKQASDLQDNAQITDYRLQTKTSFITREVTPKNEETRSRSR